MKLLIGLFIGVLIVILQCHTDRKITLLVDVHEIDAVVNEEVEKQARRIHLFVVMFSESMQKAIVVQIFCEALLRQSRDVFARLTCHYGTGIKGDGASSSGHYLYPK